MHDFLSFINHNFILLGFFQLLAPLIGAAIPGIAGLFGNKTKTPSQTNTSTTKGTNTTSGSSGSRSFDESQLSAIQQSLFDTIGQGALEDYNKAPQGVDSIINNGIKTVNSGADITKKILQNNAARAGLSFSTASLNPQAIADQSRIAQTNDVVASRPLVEQQLKAQKLQQLMQAFSTLPINRSSGTETTNSGYSTNESTTDQKGTQIVPGNPVGGLLTGLGAGLNTPTGANGSTGLDAIMKALGLG